MKVSPLFPVLFLFCVLALAFWLFGEGGSGAGVFAVLLGVAFVVAATYNRLHNGTWFTDSSGGK